MRFVFPLSQLTTVLIISQLFQTVFHIQPWIQFISAQTRLHLRPSRAASRCTVPTSLHRDLTSTSHLALAPSPLSAAALRRLVTYQKASGFSAD